jgi:hypothetical protein
MDISPGSTRIWVTFRAREVLDFKAGTTSVEYWPLWKSTLLAWISLVSDDMSVAAMCVRTLRPKLSYEAKFGGELITVSERDKVMGLWLSGAFFVRHCKERVALTAAEQKELRSAFGIEDDSERPGQYFNVAGELISDALISSRRTQFIEIQPDILLTRAEWLGTQGQLDEANASAQRSLEISAASEYRFKQAEAHLFLGGFALQCKQNRDAKSHAVAAERLAFASGPPYCYMVVLERARKLVRSAC